MYNCFRKWGFPVIVLFKLLVASYLFLLPLWSRGQEPDLKFEHLSKEQGLSNGTVQCIFQDSEGFMWFGTLDGLNKYDGYKITSYRNDPGDSTSISSNNIFALTEDKEHQLWVGTANGLNRLNKSGNFFTRFSGYARLANINITCLSADAEGRILIGTPKGLGVYDPHSGKFHIYLHAGPGQGNNTDNISCLFQDSKGRCWVGTDGGGLHIFDIHTGEFHEFIDPVEKDLLTGLSISAIGESLGGDLVIGTSGAGVYALQGGRLVRYGHSGTNGKSLSGNVVKSILTDRKGRIWVGLENGGLDLWEYPLDRFYRYENDPSRPQSLSEKTASALLEDNQGNLWVGTHRGGVDLYSDRAHKFTTFSQGPAGAGLSYKDVKGFLEYDRDHIWIATDGGGINIWDKRKNTFSYVRHDPHNSGSIGSDAVLQMVKDKESRIWVGTWNGGLNLYDERSGTFKHFYHNPNDSNSISSNNVWKIFEDSRGETWIGTYSGGLDLFDINKGVFRHITRSDDNKTVFAAKEVKSINEDRDGNIWFGGMSTYLDCYNIHTRHFEHYSNNIRRNGNTSPEATINAIFPDSKQRLWVGTQGLYLFDYDKRTFIPVSPPLLAKEIIQSITGDQDGNLWIGTDNGLFRFNPENREIVRYTENDGLTGVEFSQDASATMSNGDILFGGYQGFNVFNPKNFPGSSYQAPVYITDFQVFNKSIGNNPGQVFQTDISKAKVFRLKYSQSVFSLEYAALNFVSPAATQYQYKLEGFDKDWNVVGPQRKATFTNLNPGEYLFRVRAGAADNVFYGEAAVKIIITPPFWMTWWFRLLALSVMIGIVYTILFYRRKAELGKLEEQKTLEIQRMQLQFFTNISHELRTPLSLISGPLEQMQKSDPFPAHLPYYQMMQRNVNRLLALVSELMDFRKVESGTLKLKVMPGDINRLVYELADDFSELSLQNHIDYSIELDDTIKDPWFDHSAVEKIITNLIHNAFKYTAVGGRITVETLSSLASFSPAYNNRLVVKSDYKTSSYIHIRITDTGIGISKEGLKYLFERYYRITQKHIGSGIGLVFVKSLTLLHKGQIQVFSDKNRGTEIIISLPAAKNDYEKNERWTGNEPGTIELESIRYKPELGSISVPAGDPVLPSLDPPQLSKHILIVDDNDELRSFLRQSLQDQYRIGEASNGKEGLAKAKESFPHLILSDVMMPEMDGIEFCKRIKDDVETSHIPFILLTAKDTVQSSIEGVSSGADYYFSKPVSPELLSFTIRNIFVQRQKIRDRYSKDYKVEIKELVHSVKDKEFMEKLLGLLDEHLEGADLGVDFLSLQLSMNRTKLNEKIKAISGKSITEFVRSFRLKKAIDIMSSEDVSISEVIYRIGIQSNSYFTSAFKKEFGKTPSQFMADLKK